MGHTNTIIGKIKFEYGKYVFVSSDTDKLFRVVGQGEEFLRGLYNANKLCVVKTDDNSHCEIVEVLGNEGDAIAEGKAIAHKYNLLKETSPDVIKNLSEIETNRDDLPKYRDLRDMKFVTIDPDSAKDFDDAVCCVENADGTFTLSVAIANTAFYIKKNSALFQHVLGRHTSSYLGNMVYPMLPEKLSNDICSLNEKVDKVVMCTSMKIDKSGSIIEYVIEPAIINSKHRLTYNEVDYVMANDSEKSRDAFMYKSSVEKTKDVKDSLVALHDVDRLLRRNRYKRGALEIETIEPKFEFTDDGSDVIGVHQDTHGISAGMIESTAIACNEVWADFASRYKIPFVYRNHPGIVEEEDVKNYVEKLTSIGIFVGINSSTNVKRGDNLLMFTPHDIQSQYKKYSASKKAEAYKDILLRSMGQATLSTYVTGHYALGIRSEDLCDFNFEEYSTLYSARERYKKFTGLNTGFKVDDGIKYPGYGQVTSPIRRSWDMCNQMQIFELTMSDSLAFDSKELSRLTLQMSKFERNADSAESEYNEMLATKWAKNNMGALIKGQVVKFHKDYISLMTDEGIRVKLPIESINSFDISKERYLQFYRSLKIKDGKLKPIGIDFGDTLALRVVNTTAEPFNIIVEEDIMEKDYDTYYACN